MEKKGYCKDCNYCKNEINFDKDKFVLLGTYTGDKTNDEGYFHFDCFVEWYNKQVLAKAKTQVQGFQEKAQILFSKLTGSGALNNIAGMDSLQKMLNTDLGEKEFVVGEFENGVPTVDEMFGGEPKKKKKKKKKEKTFEEEVNSLPQ